MVPQELISYIKSQRSNGVTDSIIRANLSTQGWNNQDIDQAFAASPSSVPVPPYTSSNPSSNIELAKYRSQKKWTVFSFWMIMGVLYVIFVTQGNILAIAADFG